MNGPIVLSAFQWKYMLRNSALNACPQFLGPDRGSNSPEGDKSKTPRPGQPISGSWAVTWIQGFYDTHGVLSREIVFERLARGKEKTNCSFAQLSSFFEVLIGAVPWKRLLSQDHRFKLIVISRVDRCYDNQPI